MCVCVCQPDLLMIQYAMMLICKHSHHVVLTSSSGDASYETQLLLLLGEKVFYLNHLSWQSSDTDILSPLQLLLNIRLPDQ